MTLRLAWTLAFLVAAAAVARADSTAKRTTGDKRRIVAILDVRVTGVPDQIAAQFQIDLEKQLDSNEYWIAPRARVTELILERCHVPAANVLGPVGQGYKIAIETLNEGRIGIGAQMIGVAQGALEAATAYVKERRQFGKAIAEFQGVQFQLAQMATELEASRLMVYNAARLKDAGQPFTQDAAMAKLFSSQVADRITSQCLELFGGYGYSKEYPAEKFYRDAKIGTIYEGTSNMQLQTIAKLLLK